MSKLFRRLWDIGFAAAFLYFLFRGPDERVLAYRQLVTRHVSTEAQITSKDCPEHGHVFYAFSVEGKRYTGSTYSLGRPCQMAQVGESVPIYFDPVDPTVNTNMHPEVAYDFHWSQLLTKFLMAAALLGMLAFPFVKPRLGKWMSREGSGASR